MLTIGQAEEDDAVVDRPGQPAVTAPDPREEAFWSSAFCAALSALDQERQDDHLAAQAARSADYALVEWRKRWGRK